MFEMLIFFIRNAKKIYQKNTTKVKHLKNKNGVSYTNILLGTYIIYFC